MPANNRVHSSAALQTHGIWQSAIGYDPYAPDQKSRGGAPPPGPGANSGAGGAPSAAADGKDKDNAYDSFQGLLQLAKLTGSNADEARGACRKCHRVGHLTFQCRNFLTAKEDVNLPAEVAAGGLKGLDGGKKADKRAGEAGSKEQPGLEPEEEDETDVSDSDESEGERHLAEAARQRGLLPQKAKRGDHRGHSSSGKKSDRDRRKDKKDKKKKRRKERSPSSDSDSEDESDSEEEERRRRKERKRRKRKEERKRRRERREDSDRSDTSESDHGKSDRKRKR